MNVKTNSKKVQFGETKRKKLHIGKFCEGFKCADISVDCWEEMIVFNNEIGVDTLEENFVGEKELEEKTEEKYLGDIISNDGRNLKNIKSRIEKGKGIVSKIMSILDAFPFGSLHFEIGLLLRDSLLTSSMLSNSEAWYNITMNEMNLLETVDEIFLRRLLNAPKSTPKEMLYLELGCLPYRYLIQKRRLIFMSYIIQQDENSMIYRFFQAQKKDGTPKDWVTTVRKDLEKLNIDMNFDKIKLLRRSHLKKIECQKLEMKAMNDLEEKKLNHSKVKDIMHENFGMQKNLKMERYI